MLLSIQADDESPMPVSKGVRRTNLHFVFCHDAYYRFVTIDDPNRLAHNIRIRLHETEVLGSVLIAPEGINVMLCGTVEQLDETRNWFECDERFTDLFVKRTVCEQMVFQRLKVKVKREIVPLGLEGVDATDSHQYCASPSQWDALLTRDDVVVIDNRNSFEFDYGRFRGAIDPGVVDFRDFTTFFTEHLPEWEHKTIAMYCTGGIRCDKTAAWAATQGVKVVTLQGGIINYLQQSQNSTALWDGDCFVFDEREALDVNLQAITRSKQ